MVLHGTDLSPERRVHRLCLPAAPVRLQGLLPGMGGRGVEGRASLDEPVDGCYVLRKGLPPSRASERRRSNSQATSPRCAQGLPNVGPDLEPQAAGCMQRSSLLRGLLTKRLTG
jgi:hypothetical protein